MTGVAHQLLLGILPLIAKHSLLSVFVSWTSARMNVTRTRYIAPSAYLYHTLDEALRETAVVENRFFESIFSLTDLHVLVQAELDDCVVCHVESAAAHGPYVPMVEHNAPRAVLVEFSKELVGKLARAKVAFQMDFQFDRRKVLDDLVELRRRQQGAAALAKDEFISSDGRFKNERRKFRHEVET